MSGETTTTSAVLRELHLSAMAREFERQLEDKTCSKMGFEERLMMIVLAEKQIRQQNKYNRLLRTAQFASPEAVMEEIEFHLVTPRADSSVQYDTYGCRSSWKNLK